MPDTVNNNSDQHYRGKMKAISMDLRKRIVAAYKRGEGTQKALARRFAISKASVERYLRLYREKGVVEPKPWPGGKGREIIKESDRATILSWLKESPDITQAELAERFSKLQGRSVGRSTIGFALKRLGITRKKSHFRHQSARTRMS